MIIRAIRWKAHPDRGYLGCLPARGDDFTIVHRTTDAPLGELDKERNWTEPLIVER